MLTNIASKAEMNSALLILVGWLATLGAAGGIVLIATGNAEAGIGLLTSSIVAPLTYLTGRVQGVAIGQNGKTTHPSTPSP